jgi:acetylornithine deacetylase/succinyl-diaminopimelate desuccinylase-like protein
MFRVTSQRAPVCGTGRRMVRPLGATTIIVPIANHDDNQHTFDENLRIQNLWDGIELMAALLTT